MRFRTIFALALLLTGCQAPPGESGRSQQIPFVWQYGLVFVTLHVEGEPALALLDTGATMSAVDPALAAKHPPLGEVEVVGTSGTMLVETVRMSGVTLGERALPPFRATRRDLSGLLAPDGEVVRLILGSDLLAGRRLTLDFPRRILHLDEGTAAPPPAAIPMPLDNGIPTIPGVIGSVELSLRIDTGASLFETEETYVNITSGTWSALQAGDPDLTPTTHFSGTGADGTEIRLPVAAVRGGRIGPLDLERVHVIVQPAVGYFADPRAKGFVSNNFLEKLGRVTLDYGESLFWGESRPSSGER